MLESLGIAPLFHFWGVISVKILNCQNPKSQFVQTRDNSQSDKQDIKNLFLNAVQSGTAPKHWAWTVQPGAIHSNPLDLQLVLESLECLCFKLKELMYEDGLRWCIAVREWPLPKTLACNYTEPIKLLVRKWLTTWRGCRWGEKQLRMELAFLDSRQRSIPVILGKDRKDENVGKTWFHRR